MTDSPSTDIGIHAAAPSASAELQGLLPYPIACQVKAIPLPLLPASKRLRLLSCLRRLPLVRRMVALKEKLPLVGKKKPVPLGEWKGGPVATAPMAGANSDILPRVQPVAIVHGTWNEEAATLVLYEVRCSTKPAVPEAVVTVQVTGKEDHHPRPPIVIGWGPDSVTSETQDLEHTRGLEGGGHAGAKAVFGDAGIDGKATDKKVQHDTVKGSFVAAPVKVASGEYGGVKFQLTPARGSKHGLPTWVRLAIVYKYEGRVECHFDLKIRGTGRRFTLTPSEQTRLVWNRSQELRHPTQPCTSCVANGKNESCREFSHSDEQFWFSLLNTKRLEQPDFLPLPGGRDSWFTTSLTETGAVREVDLAQCPESRSREGD